MIAANIAKLPEECGSRESRRSDLGTAAMSLSCRNRRAGNFFLVAMVCTRLASGPGPPVLPPPTAPSRGHN